MGAAIPLFARVGFHLVASAYWDSMPTFADIVMVIETSDKLNTQLNAQSYGSRGAVVRGHCDQCPSLWRAERGQKPSPSFGRFLGGGHHQEGMEIM